MKRNIIVAMLICAAFLSACGGGGGTASSGSSGSSGTLAIAITDAKPALPAGITAVNVIINEVSVHKSGGDWVSLPLAESPFKINLLQFSDGTTTKLVPKTTLTSGTYSQLRLGVQSAEIVTNTGSYQMEIPSGNLKTDMNFQFEVKGGGAVALTVDFDLSRSIVVTGSNKYLLKPVLHLVSTSEAAKISGSIAAATFNSESQAKIIVTRDKDNSGTISAGDEDYTSIVVNKDTTDPTPFSIFWLVPDESYIVEVIIGDIPIYTEAVPAASLPPSAVYSLNSGNPIEDAKIAGKISDATFNTESQATIVVTMDNDSSGTISAGDTEYRTINVTKGTTNPTPFLIFWLLPDRSYIVEVRIGLATIYTEAVPAASLPPGAVFSLNSDNPL